MFAGSSHLVFFFFFCFPSSLSFLVCFSPLLNCWHSVSVHGMVQPAVIYAALIVSWDAWNGFRRPIFLSRLSSRPLSHNLAGCSYLYLFFFSTNTFIHFSLRLWLHCFTTEGKREHHGAGHSPIFLFLSFSLFHSFHPRRGISCNPLPYSFSPLSFLVFIFILFSLVFVMHHPFSVKLLALDFSPGKPTLKMIPRVKLVRESCGRCVPAYDIKRDLAFSVLFFSFYLFYLCMKEALVERSGGHQGCPTWTRIPVT